MTAAKDFPAFSASAEIHTTTTAISNNNNNNPQKNSAAANNWDKAFIACEFVTKTPLRAEWRGALCDAKLIIPRKLRVYTLGDGSLSKTWMPNAKSKTAAKRKCGKAVGRWRCFFERGKVAVSDKKSGFYIKWMSMREVQYLHSGGEKEKFHASSAIT